ncbi:hypothetical protein IFM89_002152 [Coptis chinensis]|uniref:Nuclear transcription factor Y subunit n=1 Tax=Coptis chinensis TaxID=261450 RepID=A0A835I7A3_9MAGN|nr:hypothetical protein IFM89_002152 [Coptis chinensis]
MQNISNKDSYQTSLHLMSPAFVNCQSWLTSSESQVPQSSLSSALSLNVDSHHCCYKGKQSSHKQDQDSSSTQSTGQSHLEVPHMEGCNPHRQSGFSETVGKRAEGHMKSVLSLGTPDFILPTSQADYSQSLARIPYSYPDPYFGGMLAPCAPQAIIHPPMLGMTLSRVPLPLDPAEDEPIYVNPKQYRGILRRRESRAKLEAQNKLIKSRKPYLHESRHLHALKRVRGSGGRFLNTNKSQQSERSCSNGQKAAERALLKLRGHKLESEVLQSETCNTGGSHTSCSETTSVSNGYVTLQMSDLRFSSYPSHTNGPLLSDGAIMGNGSQYRVPVIR